MSTAETVGSSEQVRGFLEFLEWIADEHSWQAEAACVGKGDLFFPPSGHHHLATEAKRICLEECPVLRECRKFSKDEVLGVWGGRSVEERRELRRGDP